MRSKKIRLGRNGSLFHRVHDCSIPPGILVVRVSGSWSFRPQTTEDCASFRSPSRLVQVGVQQKYLDADFALRFDQEGRTKRDQVHFLLEVDPRTDAIVSTALATLFAEFFGIPRARYRPVGHQSPIIMTTLIPA
jgi:hypothetical protein